MKLDIIVPHYKEPWNICKYLFDTICTQRGVLFEDIRVIVVNDGEGKWTLELPESNLNSLYPFHTDVYTKKHEGVSAARNYGLDQSTADYVMFCDADDGFLNNYALHLVFSAMQEGVDFLCGAFIEETWDDKGNPMIVPHTRDLTFMHGKAYKREFLLENDLRFDPAMTIHEDGYFNMLVYAVSKHNGTIKYVDTPYYLWRWNNNSVVRKDLKDFVLRTYPDVMLTRIGLCDQLKKRGYEEDYVAAVCMTVLNSFYDFQKPSYRTVANEKLKKIGEGEFKKFYNKHGKTFKNTTNLKISEFATAARETALKEGFLIEQESVKQWLKHIEYEVR